MFEQMRELAELFSKHTPDPHSKEPSERSLRLTEIQKYAYARAAPAFVLCMAAWASLSTGPLALILAPLLLLCALTLLLPALASRLLARMGLVQAASIIAFADGWSWGRDRIGGRSVTLALWLLSNDRRRAPADQRRIEASLEVSQLGARRLTSGVVLAEGIRAFLRGDRACARRLWRFVVEFDRRTRAPLAARIAVDLLAAEAVEHGDLDRMAREIARPRMPSTGLTELLTACVQKLRGEIVPESILRGKWLFSGSGSRTRPLVERAIAIAPVAQPPSPTLVDPLDAALVATARLGESGPVRRSSVHAASLLWDKLFDDGTKVPSAIEGDLRASVIEALSELLSHATDAPSPSEGSKGLLREVVWRCADRKDEHLRWLSTELGARTDQKKAVPLLEEVKAWCAMLEAYEDLLLVAPERAVSSFARLYYPGVRLAVWLHNERGQATLANAMYRVLLRHAEAVGHEAGIALLRNNLSCGP